jgi:hypothetical protein
MNSSTPQLDIILWGDTQAGKTTALTAYLCQDPRKPDWLDRKAEETSQTLQALSAKYWRRLKLNQLPAGTLNAEFFPLKHKDGRLIRFRDMRGGDAVDLERVEDRQALQQAAALLIFVEWPNQRIAPNYLAFENALRFTACPFALVITKIESYLTPEQAMLFMEDPLGLAQRLKVGESFISLLKQTLLWTRSFR